MKIGARRVRSDVAHLYSLKDHGHGVRSEPKIMARRARTPENEACELGVALISGDLLEILGTKLGDRQQTNAELPWVRAWNH